MNYKPIILEAFTKKILGTVVIDKNLWRIPSNATDEQLRGSGGFFTSGWKQKRLQRIFVTFEATGCEFVAPSVIKSSEVCSRTSSFLRVPFLCPLLGLFQLSWQRAPFSPTQIPKIEDYVMAWCIWICPILDSFFFFFFWWHLFLPWSEKKHNYHTCVNSKELVWWQLWVFGSRIGSRWYSECIPVPAGRCRAAQ